MKLSKRVLGVTTFILLTAFGCSNPSDTDISEVHTTGNPDAEEILTLEPEADIFQFEGIIYQAGIDWVEELTLTKDKQVGEITTRNELNTNFENNMANKLPVGAKIFSIKESGEVGGPILLVESEGKLFKYLGLVEG